MTVKRKIKPRTPNRILRQGGLAVGVEEGNRRFPSGMTNKGLGRLHTNCSFALISLKIVDQAGFANPGRDGD
jgi:hypothetical protein